MVIINQSDYINQNLCKRIDNETEWDTNEFKKGEYVRLIKDEYALSIEFIENNFIVRGEGENNNKPNNKQIGTPNRLIEYLNEDFKKDLRKNIK